MGIIFKGADRFIHNYGTENIFLGINAGNFTMMGYQNTSFGNFSLNVNTAGFENTAEGNYSLRSNTLGNRNTSVGYASLYTNIMGNHNTALGNSSLFSNTGSFNTAVGSSSLFGNTTGSNNTAVGYQSLFSNTSFNNTTVGYQSLFGNTTGGNNTAVGYHALYSNTTGKNNTAIGTRSLYLNTGLNNTSIGYESLSLSTTSNSSTAIGWQSLHYVTTGDFNTALGYISGSLITTGSNLTCIGFDAEPSSESATNQVTLGNAFVTSLRCNVTTITSLSDARDKKNISNLSLGLDFITKLKPRQFNWDKREWYEDNISDGSKMQETPTAGFIAQELDEAQTTANTEWLNLVLKDNPEKWEATPGNLLPIMVKAIQELNSKCEDLETENDVLRDKLAKFEQMQNMLVGEIEKIKSKDSNTKEVRVTEQ